MLCLITDDSHMELVLVRSRWTYKAKLVNSVLFCVESDDGMYRVAPKNGTEVCHFWATLYSCSFVCL